MTTTATHHPAPFSEPLYGHLDRILSEWPNPISFIIDPFAGIGGIHRLGEMRGIPTAGIEIEPEWADQHPRTVCGDSTSLTAWAAALAMADGMPLGAVVTSPAYANRMADFFEASNGKGRRSYGFSLGRRPSGNSSGGMQWGEPYRELHRKAWANAAAALAPRGLLLLNCKDHSRNRQRVPVTDWHIGCLEDLGLELVDRFEVNAPGYRNGANRDLRFQEELVTFGKAVT